ncbi:hypothetical protein GQX74_013145 [Glossina fuscipes]|nr:hypothetical protein GQX74_013145 [Glossina fuscipes]
MYDYQTSHVTPSKVKQLVDRFPDISRFLKDDFSNVSKYGLVSEIPSSFDYSVLWMTSKCHSQEIMAKRSVITFLVACKLRYDKPCNVLKTTRFSLRSACIGDNLYCAEKVVQAYPICVKFLIWLFDAAIVKFYIVRWIFLQLEVTIT